MDKHNRPIQFDRKKITESAMITVRILRAHQSYTNRNNDSQKSQECIDHRYYLLAIFDDIMNTCAATNDKRTWMCKSMGMSKYHDMLLTMYGQERLRYIYLVRDPRDVTLSFMKTPVGDCHPYVVAEKWANLQNHAMKILSKNSDLILQVRYEDIIRDKVTEVAKINEFIGQRRTGKVMRRGSVVMLKSNDQISNDSRRGHEAIKASLLSYQFKNLTRGDSFTKKQYQKWVREMKTEDREVVETTARQEMQRLGYDCEEKKCSSTICYSEGDIETFRALNEQLVDEMNKNLLVGNPDDFQRRAFQAEVLNFDPEFISSSFENDVINIDDIGLVEEEGKDDLCDDEFLHHDFRTWPMDAQHFGYLSEQTIASMLITTDCKEITLGDGRSISFAAASQAGYYPSKNGKDNEDSFLCCAGGLSTNATNPSKLLSGDETVEDHNPPLLFSIFDGHGPKGKASSAFVRDIVEKELEHQLESTTKRRRDIESIFYDAYMEANERLLQTNDFDTDYSGTTAVSLCLDSGFFHVANVGDSRCVIASRSSKDEDYYVQDLSDDHSPAREDEYTRIRSNGGIILTSDQYDAMENSQHTSTSSSAMAFSSVVNDSSSSVEDEYYDQRFRSNRGIIQYDAIENSQHSEMSVVSDSSTTTSSSVEPLRVWGPGGKYPGEKIQYHFSNVLLIIII
jgi:serine/threonine protein phosphatase PrpC